MMYSPKPKSSMVTCLSLLLFISFSLPKDCDSLPVPSIQFNTPQWEAMVRDAVKLIQQQNEPHNPREKSKIRFMIDPAPATISRTGKTSPDSSSAGNTGMVKLRNIRSGLGDMANMVRLVQLHELEREWASKARPRFGKRGEVIQENFLPSYSYTDDSKDEEYDLQGQSKFSSEDHEQRLGPGRMRHHQDWEDYFPISDKR